MHNIKSYTQILEDDTQKEQWREISGALLHARQQLAKICTEVSQGVWTRSRAKWDFQTDKSTRMYLI